MSEQTTINKCTLQSKQGSHITNWRQFQLLSKHVPIRKLRWEAEQTFLPSYVLCSHTLDHLRGTLCQAVQHPSHILHVLHLAIWRSRTNSNLNGSQWTPLQHSKRHANGLLVFVPLATPPTPRPGPTCVGLVKSLDHLFFALLNQLLHREIRHLVQHPKDFVPTRDLVLIVNANPWKVRVWAYSFSLVPFPLHAPSHKKCQMRHAVWGLVPCANNYLGF